MLALVAGVLLNFVPCVLPVIPLKVRAVLREIKGDIRSRILAAICLLCGSLFFFLILGGATAYLGLTWGALFQDDIVGADLDSLHAPEHLLDVDRR
jgi:thiol:disulfide interchange protein